MSQPILGSVKRVASRGAAVLCVLLGALPAYSQWNINTYAGNGSPGYSGDGIQAMSAAINAPRGTAIDAAGNLYIADSGNYRVRRVATNGIITTVAGLGGLGSGGDGGL